MANFFVDAEFDVPTDTLISLAIVSEDGQRTFYEVLDYSNIQDDWVKANVIPILEKAPISWEEFQDKLEKFVMQFPGMNIIVNHPNDVLYFCKALMGDKGKWIKVQPLTFDIDDKLSGKGSTLLHNALHDAIATKKDWFKHYG
ncbi:putative exonuclease [Pseudomonas phage Phabio]|uniref:Putative exonuclease n=1 Tax=Pseudomonas phage Phabio TaxID=2006668 RepID=A0A1Y0SYT4_9CAUD|nr:Rnase H [Pseudomonas phage Phabio]ARV76923.1 putative exonuclease [Pseudomonas phage Phabio]